MRASVGRASVGWLAASLVMGLAAGEADAQLLRIYTTPPGAQVVIDGRATPLTTPAQLHLCSGPHAVELHKAGYSAVRRKLMIAPGNPRQLQVELPFNLNEAEPSLPQRSYVGTGTLSMATSTPGAVIRINGRPVKQQTPLILPINSGYYIVQLTHPGATVARAVVISRGQTTKLRVSLAPGGATEPRASRSRTRLQSRPPSRSSGPVQQARPAVSAADWPAYRDSCLKGCTADSFVAGCNTRLKQCTRGCPGIVAGKVVNAGAFYSCADLCKSHKTYCIKTAVSGCKKRCNTR